MGAKVTSVKTEHSRGAVSPQTIEALSQQHWNREAHSHYANARVSFSNDVCTPLRSHPYLVYSTSLNVDSITHGVCLLLGIFLFRINNRKLSSEDQMGGQTLVGVRAVVRVPVAKSVSPVSRQ